MAKELGISQNTYSKIENGEIKMSNEKLQGISDILEISISKMLNYDDGITLNIKEKDNKDSFIGCYNTNHFHKAEKELYFKLLEEKDNAIKLLKEKISKLEN